MKRAFSFVLGAAMASVITAAACGKDATAPALSGDVVALRESLSPYSSFTIAKNAGYSTAITDCLSNGDQGAMGIHFAKVATLDGALDPLHPESLIYEPGTNGEMSLVGVEFIVPYTSVPKTSPPPVLFGQTFMANDTYGVWGLHVWTQRTNPSGTFAMWNPRVHC